MLRTTAFSSRKAEIFPACRINRRPINGMLNVVAVGLANMTNPSDAANQKKSALRYLFVLKIKYAKQITQYEAAKSV